MQVFFVHTNSVVSKFNAIVVLIYCENSKNWDAKRSCYNGLNPIALRMQWC